MNNFKKALEKKLIKSRYNNFSVENYDEYRFGKYTGKNLPPISTWLKFKRIVKNVIGYKTRQILNAHSDFLTKYENRLQKIYEQLNTQGQGLLVDIISYRLLGHTKVRLPGNNKEYWKTIEIGNSLANPEDTYDPHFMHFILQKCDLRKIGYDIQLYHSGSGVAIDFIFEQYSYKTGDKTIVGVEEGDVVLDLGACWGDTALYFACKTGENGKVYSFEFIPENIKIYNINISLNPNMVNQIELIQFPVSNRSGDVIYFYDNGPSSRIEFEPFDEQTGTTTTISIDDFFRSKSNTKVDFIKMDIEGAELVALAGAIETIKRFKPKLAIAIYHSSDDFVNIPIWIMELNLGYKLYLNHYTIHSEETVIFAKVEEE